MKQRTLLLYDDPTGQSVLSRMTALYGGQMPDPHQRARELYGEAHRLLELAVRFGFRGNVWHHYLALYLLTHENPFSLLCERMEPTGTLPELALQDFRHLRRLFDYDFAPLEASLDVSCMSLLSDFTAPEPGEAAGAAVRALTARLEQTATAEEMLQETVAAYRSGGAGELGLYRAFRFRDGRLQPVRSPDPGTLADIVGYDEQKQALRANTEAFLAGRSANNVLLYGDSGTGKSSCIRALVNEYGTQGLRMIGLHRYQFRDISAVLDCVRDRGLHFILLLDDLSFEDNETEYKFLKAAIEGGVESWPENVLLYATSNRRHLIRERWSDRSDMEHDGDIHRSDTMEEKLSLAERFGLALRFDNPARQEYHRIVRTLAERHGVTDPAGEELLRQADAWEIRHGGPSGRAAEQFIRALAGKE